MSQSFCTPVDDYQYSEGNTNTVLRTNKRGLRAK
uniref:Uncharacterized protein MANES_05G148500 n=1 Tax=Rhizophora mucronata TaxID=61149 RepID=A0A2P2IH04_RHIMU